MQETLILKKEEITVGKELTPKQELFCRLFTQNAELFGNATLSYAEAYQYDLDAASRERPDDAKDTIFDPDEDIDEDEDHAGNEEIFSEGKKKYALMSEYERLYNTCSASASRLLRNDKINARVLVLLNEMMQDQIIDAELIKIVLGARRNSDRISAIREYNQVKGRIVRRKEISGPNGGPINIVSDERKKELNDALDDVFAGKN